MPSKNSNRTTITLVVEEGKIVSIASDERAKITTGTSKEIEKISKSKAGFRHTTTMLYDQQLKTCCYWIWIGGRWVKVSVPCSDGM